MKQLVIKTTLAALVFALGGCGPNEEELVATSAVETAAAASPTATTHPSPTPTNTTTPTPLPQSAGVIAFTSDRRGNEDIFSV